MNVDRIDVDFTDDGVFRKLLLERLLNFSKGLLRSWQICRFDEKEDAILFGAPRFF